MKGIVIFKAANQFLVHNLNTKKIDVAMIRKKTKETYNIMVGDYVEYNEFDGHFVIEVICSRKNYLIRPKIANIDNVLLVYSVKEPDYSSFLLNKFLAFYEARNVDNVIIYFSKWDLLNNDEVNKMQMVVDAYKKNGYQVFISNKKEEQKDKLISLLKNKTTVFAGQSGVGKSTFINYLIPNINIKTQEISKSLNRGKHTTTSSTMISFNDGFIIDTPGFSSIDLNLTKYELASAFNDFRKAATMCKFSNCLHDKEKGCHVKKMVETNEIDKTRYDDYLKMLNQTK